MTHSSSHPKPVAPKLRSRLLKLLLILVSAILFLIGSGFLCEAIASHSARKSYPAPGQLVDAGGYNLHIRQLGAGAPTIILEAGSGETSLSWRDIPEQLAEQATVVTYDRAGYAWSGQADTERSGANIVRELHTALKNAEIPGPYLMVGHSLGGMYARLFTQTYLDEVTGLVLIDARPENDDRETKPILAAENVAGNPSASLLSLLKRSGVLRLFQDQLLAGLVAPQDRGAFINVISTPSYFAAKEQEATLTSSTEDAIRGQNFGSLPVKVIARGLPQDYASFGVSEGTGQQLEAIWQEGQRSMLKLSSNSELIVAGKSGHMVIHDQPEVVVQTIQGMLRD
ncbi:alpha/beta hydrolase [Paenibacillus sp. FSL P4-0338]|uniref:alpha/beta fold hydrolase n=1 Tax=unclassified Paenibacillus TaxID=185978 RepID=UPI0003E1EFBF|nr:alpha/beta hydrolase [Paenibacillus sp. FSL R7-269]ETT40397.1 alpha/beta hydrolase [Paenibacillus sp. FSL R7-269]